jgi:ribonuclease HI
MWFFGHYAHATNNAMEIRAIVEAFRTLPQGMHVWISTDYAYVKSGGAQWIGNWIKNSWRTGNGTPVANESLWQKLIEVVKLPKRVEWSWMKAHSGILLNECADILATRVVMNVKPRRMRMNMC